MELSDLQETRQAKVDHLREHDIEPYPARSARTHTTTEALVLFDAIEADSAAVAASPITIAGRIVSERNMGKTVFAHLRDGHGQLQLYLRRDVVGDEAFAGFTRLFDLGDFAEATGTLFRTKTGEVSLRVQSIRMLAKALNAPPEKWHGLTDIETRYRQRYADLLANAEVREVFRRRSVTVSSIRRFLDGRGYLEVETPSLQPLYGGAAARPFTTYYNSLDQPFYLRIADELYLKRLIVGGYERVYEIAKDYRNEGIDRFHLQEFTMLEFYEAYADYETMMDTVEAMLHQVVVDVFGEPRLVYQGNEIDFSGPWRRQTLRAAIQEASGVDYVEHPEQPDLLRAARAAGADVPTDTVWPKIVDELLKQFVRPNMIQPTFLYDYPVALSPLAKKKPCDPTHAERFQAFFGAAELVNAFTELNDPLDQLARFQAQQRDQLAGDEDAMQIDLDYINALMFGMPPTGGVGLGIDRLTMVLTDLTNIRDVVLFPAMRSLRAEAAAE